MATKLKFLAGTLALENKPYHDAVAKLALNLFSECEGYLAYKYTTLGRASDEDVPSFILVTREHGIVLLDVVEDRICDCLQEDGIEYWRLEQGGTIKARSLVMDLYEGEVQSRLKNNLALYDRKKRQSIVPTSQFVVFCRNGGEDLNAIFNKFEYYPGEPIHLDNLEAALNDTPREFNCSVDTFDSIIALLDGTFIYEAPAVYQGDGKLETINDFIQRSLKITFKQDEAQRVASMQLTPGPQRIRGLAGTGKTIVLSLKAAITHKRFENFKILYLFNTQSLYQHVQTLIAKHYTLEAKKAPDFDTHVHVLHAWGGRQKPGLYSTLCKSYGLQPLTFEDVRGAKDGLEYIYADLLKRITNFDQVYDLVLIDEAQDFPQPLFELVYKITKGSGAQKRIVWAYDEFQSLKETSIKGPAELFGKSANGDPNMPDEVLSGVYDGGIKKDFVLPNCYRTPRSVLMHAHGIALGLYSQRPNEMFYYSEEWRALGYQVNKPESLVITAGEAVEVERTDENSRNRVEGLLRDNGYDPDKLVVLSTFSDEAGQFDNVAEQIVFLINEQHVAPEEIIVINLQSGNNKGSMLKMQRSLSGRGVDSVIPGYIESADVFKPKGFVTITTPFRAKGNEASVVYVVNAQSVVSPYSLRGRNAFFVAVTRSRGWCFVSGFGGSMAELSREMDAIKADIPKFKFICPDPEQVKNRKRYLDKSDKDLAKFQQVMDIIENDPDLRHMVKERFGD
jgi:superfamily I DNA and RNA helicase